MYIGLYRAKPWNCWVACPSRSHQGSKGRSWGPLLSLSKKDATNMIGKAARGLVSPTCPTPHTGTNSSQIGLQAYSMKVHHPAGMICPWKPICTWLFSVANWFGVSSACMQILLWVGEERMLSPSCFPEQFCAIKELYIPTYLWTFCTPYPRHFHCKLSQQTPPWHAWCQGPNARKHPFRLASKQVGALFFSTSLTTRGCTLRTSWKE